MQLVTNLFLQAANTTKVGAQKINRTANQENLFVQDYNINTDVKKQNETITDSFDVEIDSLVSISIKISDNATLLSCSGASSLSGIAFGASSKAFSVINSLRTCISTYSSEIAAILNNSLISENEKESKIKSITNKIKALIEEAKDKTSELYNITLMLMSMASTFIVLEKEGQNTSSFLLNIKEMINNFNSSPTDLSGVESKNDIYEKINNSENIRFGKNTKNELKEYINKENDEIKNIEQKLKSNDINQQEKTALKQELLIHKSLKRVYELFV